MPVQSSSHKFPLFYACYLLKSIQTPKSQATYIGSTPNPPRRIRQHNGEISQGAWKTKHKRPWVMQMIVYGFPSKLAALQFEWAWQHPHLSRHLRDQDGKALFAGTRKLKLSRGCINTVRIMICSHPYNTWPLHVKLFTAEAVKHWQEVGNTLSPGFTYQIELEGVDGNSGSVGSGRKGPLDVTDEKFTNTFLAKHEALAASGRRLLCSLCNKHLDEYVIDPTTIVLCPNQSCTAVAHTLCLSEYFLSSEQKTTSAFIPRGGHCPVCEIYTLWGDVIRGSYRRSEASGSENAKKNRDPDKNIMADQIPKKSGRRNRETVKNIAPPETGEENDVWSLDESSDSCPDVENECLEDFAESSPAWLLLPESATKRSSGIYPLAIARSRETRPCVDLPLAHALAGLTLTSDEKAKSTSDVTRELSKIVIELSD